MRFSIFIVLILLTVAVVTFPSADAVEEVHDEVMGFHGQGSGTRVILEDIRTTGVRQDVSWLIIADGTVQYTCGDSVEDIRVNGSVRFDVHYEQATDYHVVFLMSDGTFRTFDFRTFDPYIPPVEDPEPTITVSEHDREIVTASVISLALSFIGFFAAYRLIKYRRSMEVVDV